MNALLLTRTRFRIALWWEARILPFQVSPDRPLSWVSSFANRSSRLRYPDLEAGYVLRHVLAVTRRPYLMRDRRCLRQGLLAYRFLRAAGYDTELHFGIDPTRVHEADMRAHCWIVHGGRVIFNAPPAGMLPVFVLGSEGSNPPKRDAA